MPVYLTDRTEQDRAVKRFFFRFAITAALALASAALSVFVERWGPELAPYGNLCGPQSSEPCMELVLNAGFPIAFLFDQAGVSVEHRLSVLEDQFRIGAFAMNAGFYWLLYGLVFMLLRALIGRSARSAGSTSAL